MNLDQLMFYDKKLRPWPTPRLTRASIVGHTTETSARIWVRAQAEGDYCLIVATASIPATQRPRMGNLGQAVTVDSVGNEHPFPGRVYQGMATLSFRTDATHTFDVENLQAGTRYYYALFSLDQARSEKWEIGRDEDCHFTTTASNPGMVSFGVYSCHMPFVSGEVQRMRMWRHFRQALGDAHAAFVLGVGDQVYTDGDNDVSIWRWLRKVKDDVYSLGNAEQIRVMASWYRDIYRGYWGHPDLQSVLRNLPNYMIWDDHEIMDGWGSYTEDELSDQLDTWWQWENKPKNLHLAKQMFVAAQQTYLEYEHSHNPPTPTGQFDYSFRWASIGAYVLDLRGKRDFERAQDPVLGAQQWQRFQEWLAGPALEAETVLIVSSVPVLHYSNFIVNAVDMIPGLGTWADDVRDEWEHRNNTVERNRLLDAVFDFSHRERKRVVFVSGDVHVSGSFRLHRKGRPMARVYQLTSSGITYASAPGWLLQLAVLHRGRVKGATDTSYERLQPVMADNNFGIAHVWDEGRGMSWDLFGRGRKGTLEREKRLVLE